MSATSAMTRSDRVGLYLTIALSAVGIAVTAWSVVSRLIEVLPGRDVPVTVPFDAESASLPIGPAMFGILALGVVAAAFQIGERLQRDTEGLV